MKEKIKNKDYLYLKELISKDEILLLPHKRYRGISKLVIYGRCGLSFRYFEEAYKTGKIIFQIGNFGPRIGMPIPWQKVLLIYAEQKNGGKFMKEKIKKII